MNALDLILANYRPNNSSSVNNQLISALQSLPPEEAAQGVQLPVQQAMQEQASSMDSHKMPEQNIPTTPPPEARTFTDNSMRPYQQKEVSTRKGIFDSNLAQIIGGIARGMASGSTDSESLGLGGIGAINTAQALKHENETVNWLKNQGISDDQARMMARDRNLLNNFLTARNKPKYTFSTTPSGETLRMDPITGEVETVYKSAPKESYYVTTTPDGEMVTVNQNTGVVTPIDVANNEAFAPQSFTVRLDENNLPIKEDQEKFISTVVPSDYQQLVKSVIEGRTNINSIPAAKGTRNRILRYVTQADPTWNVNDATSRAKLAANYQGGGDMFKARNAANLAISHLSTLNNAYKGIGNGSIKFVNELKNMASSYLPEGQRQISLAEFERARRALADELAKVFSQKGSTSETAASTWFNSLSPDLSPQAWDKAMRSIVDLLAGRAQTYRTGYENVFGNGKSQPFLDKETVEHMIKDLGIPPREIQKLDPRFDFSKLSRQ